VNQHDAREGLAVKLPLLDELLQARRDALWGDASCRIGRIQDDEMLFYMPAPPTYENGGREEEYKEKRASWSFHNARQEPILGGLAKLSGDSGHVVAVRQAARCGLLSH
jgi:hypothetical protein